MLRSFHVENHKSIKGEAELLLMPTYDKGPLAVPVAGIFGANASGKSNLLDALGWMRDAVVSSHFRWDPDSGVPRRPFLFDDDGRTRTSVYITELVIDSVRFTYGFEVDDQQVIEEWLYTYPKNRKRTIFERENGKITFGSTVGETKERAAALADITRANSLFLSVAGRSKLQPAAAVAGWFEHGLRVLNTRLGSCLSLDFGRMIDSSPGHAEVVTKLLSAADVGISGVDRDADGVADRMAADEALKTLARQLGVESSHRRLALQHGARHTSLPFEQESAGTRAWLGLVMNVVESFESGLTLIVDEIESSLHSRLTGYLVRLFHNTDANPRGGQLIFATHDASLLSSIGAEEILHRDEIWFMEKDGDSGESKLFALTDFHPRKEDSRERRYLGGAYGAVPGVALEDLRCSFGLDPWELPDAATA